MLAAAGALTLSLLDAAPASAKDERIVFEQDEFGWVFERSNTLCVARGNFEGEDGKTAFIELRKDSPADIVKVLMVSEGLSMPRLEAVASYRAYYRLNLEDARQPIVALSPFEDGLRRLVSMFEVYLVPRSPSSSTLLPAHRP